MKQRWSCPHHNYPLLDDYEGDHWLEPGEVCLDCETGRYVNVRDGSGCPVEEIPWNAQKVMNEIRSQMAAGPLKELRRPSLLRDLLPPS